MLKIEFITTEYELSHGRKPRGPGGWIFTEKRRASSTDPHYGFFAPSYSDAKKQFVKKLKSEGVTGYFEVYVCP